MYDIINVGNMYEILTSVICKKDNEIFTSIICMI